MEETKGEGVIVKVFYGSEVTRLSKITTFASLIEEICARYSLKNGEFQLSYFTSLEDDTEITDDDTMQKAIKYFEGKIPKFVVRTEEMINNDMISDLKNDNSDIKVEKADNKDSLDKDSRSSAVANSEALKQLDVLSEKTRDIKSNTEVLRDNESKPIKELKSSHYPNYGKPIVNAEIDQGTLEKLTQCITDAAKKELKEFIPQLIKEYEEKIHEQELRRDISLYRGVEHTGVACSKCENSPIMGIRYKCAICENFDICSRCEASIEHKHALLKFKTPKDFRQFIKQVSKY